MNIGWRNVDLEKFNHHVNIEKMTNCRSSDRVQCCTITPSL